MRVAINGFGRIGRTFFRQAFGHPGIKIVAINDLTDEATLAYLLTYDTVYGRYEKKVEAAEESDKNYLVVNGQKVLSLTEKDPAKLPWKELDIDVVIESTGVFESEEDARKHIAAGARYVIVSAPSKGNVPHVLIGVNTKDLEKSNVLSNASCTTNAIGPVAQVMVENPGVEKALLATVHGYTASQNLVDGPQKGFVRARAAAQNIVITTTGAAEATAKAVPELTGVFTGVALRVPIIAGSIIDFTFVAKRNVTVEEINSIFERAAKEARWKGILEVTYEPLVSSDILKTTAAAIVDLNHTKVAGGNLVKVFAWYDNEWGYSATLLREVLELGKLIKI
jgi:glyceraldehyde 3-phosphate dehydrogenase